MLLFSRVSPSILRFCGRWQHFSTPQLSTICNFTAYNCTGLKLLENQEIFQSHAVNYPTAWKSEKRFLTSLPFDGGSNVRFEKENIWTVPNLLSMLRIVSSPFLGYLVLNHHFGWAFGFLAVAGMTDITDGVIARHFKSQSSQIGSVLDPLADKCLITILCITLTIVGLLPLPLTVLIISRDAVLVGGSFYLRYVTLPPPRTWSRYWDVQRSTIQVTPTIISKVNTLLQLSLIGLSLGAPLVDCVRHPILQTLWYVTASTTIFSGLSYAIQMEGYRILIKKKPKSHQPKSTRQVH